MPKPGPWCSAISLLGLASLALGSGCGLTELVVDEVGDAPQCAAAATWPAEFANLEDQFVARLAVLRDTGVTCGEAELPGVGDVTVIPELRCAARLDATVRVENGDIDGDSPNVASAFARVNLAGYDGIVRHQLIAADFFDAESLVGAWVDSDTHCRALLDKNIVHIGIGHSRTVDDAESVWVVFTGEDRE